MTCVPDIQPAHDQPFWLAPERDTSGAVSGLQAARSGSRLRAIHTPGHASNHVCYLLEESSVLFSGDHVLDGVTPVILPPDGDMTAYLDSLARLKAYQPAVIAPGHGRMLRNPIAVIDAVIRHRARREAKVLAVLAAQGSGTLDELLPQVYDDVRTELLSLARLTLEAHLLKLVRERRAARQGAVWVACAG